MRVAEQVSDNVNNDGSRRAQLVDCVACQRLLFQRSCLEKVQTCFSSFKIVAGLVQKVSAMVQQWFRNGTGRFRKFQNSFRNVANMIHKCDRQFQKLPELVPKVA